MKSCLQRMLPRSLEARRLLGNRPAAEACLGPLPTLPSVDGLHLKMGDAAGERLTRLFETIDGSRAEKQELAGTPSSPAVAIDQTTEDLEYVRKTVNLIEDDQLSSTRSRSLVSIRRSIILAFMDLYSRIARIF